MLEAFDDLRQLKKLFQDFQSILKKVSTDWIELRESCTRNHKRNFLQAKVERNSKEFVYTFKC